VSRTALAIVIVLVIDACKDEPAPAREAPVTAAMDARPIDPKRWRGLVRELPVIEGAKQLVPPRTTPEGDDTFTSWCLDTRELAVATARVADTLRGDGWRDVAVHGGEGTQSVSAVYGDRRIAIVMGGVDAACAGIVASATVVRVKAP
jgi:hypothetical protein